MNLAVFDIDGTLTRSKAADGECYADAWKDEFGVENVSVHTEDFIHSTDSGVASEIFLERLGREGTEDEVARLIARFVGLMRERAGRSPEDFELVPGAGAALARLRDDGNWALAIATGCWRRSADFKIRAAGLDVEGIPLATSDELLQREDIVSSAIREAKVLHGIKGADGGFGKTVYVGDGVWDCRAAARMKIAFLGVHDTRDPAPLREAGARVIIRDYSDLDVFLKGLEAAGVPSGA